MTCRVEGCNDEVKIVSRMLCGRHYRQAYRKGFPDDMPESTPKREPNKDGREVPEWEEGLVTHTPSGTIILHGGSGMGYRSYGCRCHACREANRYRVETERTKRMERNEIPTTVKHGKPSTYSNWGCRCDSCSKAWIDKCNTYYSKVLSAEARYKAEMEAYEAGLKNGPKPVRKRLRRVA